MSTNSIKDNLRREFLTKRKALNISDVAVRSHLLVQKLISESNGADVIHCFLPLVDDNEPDLRKFIEEMITQGKQVYTSDPVSRRVKKIKKSEPDQFQLGDDIEFDLIVTPMIGFSGSHRLGFGGGFYDKFLATQPNAKKIGVCFKEFEISNLVIESHDQPLDKIINV